VGLSMALGLNHTEKYIINSYLHIIKVPFLFEKVKVVNVNMPMPNERASYFYFFYSSYVWEFRSENKKYTFVDLADVYRANDI
jgi:hypothetical protein